MLSASKIECVRVLEEIFNKLSLGLHQTQLKKLFGKKISISLILFSDAIVIALVDVRKKVETVNSKFRSADVQSWQLNAAVFLNLDWTNASLQLKKSV